MYWSWGKIRLVIEGVPEKLEKWYGDEWIEDGRLTVIDEISWDENTETKTYSVVIAETPTDGWWRLSVNGNTMAVIYAQPSKLEGELDEVQDDAVSWADQNYQDFVKDPRWWIDPGDPSDEDFMDRSKKLAARTMARVPAIFMKFLKKLGI